MKGIMDKPPIDSALAIDKYRGLDWALHNPQLLERQELIDRFLIRRRLLDELVSQMRNQPAGYGLRHFICLGQRGMGKTTLLCRLCYFIEDDRELSSRWQTVLFNEENYAVGDLADFFEESLKILASSTAQPQLALAVEQLSETIADPEDRAERMYTELVGFCQRSGRRLVLLVDNLNEILRLMNDSQAHRLRELLMAEPHLLIIGTAPTYFSEITDYQKPFYEFFRIFRLEGLSEAEMEAFLRALAEHHKDDGVLSVLSQHPERVRSLRQLTGGNPRIALYLYRLLAESPHGEIRRDLEKLIDEVTPFYKHRLEAMEQPQRKLFDAMARHWHPIPVAQLAAAVRMSEETVLEPLRGMRDSGYVEEIAEESEPLRYQVAERMCNIYYLMRFDRGGRRRMLWLVQFLKAFYEPATLRALADKWVHAWRAADLTPQKAAERTSSLLLIAQALPSDETQTEVLMEAIDFAESGGVEPDHWVRLVADAFAGSMETQKAMLPVMGKLLRLMNYLEADPQKQVFLERWLDAKPDSALGWRLLGHCQLARGLAQQSIGTARRIIELDPRSPEGWLMLCRAAFRAGEWAVTQEALGQLRLLNPTHPEIEPHEIGLQLEEGQVDAAERRLQAALADKPQEDWVWSFKTRLHEIRGELPEALEAARKTTEISPAVAPFWRNLTLLADRLGRNEEAYAAAKKSVEVDPTFGEGWALLAVQQAKRGELQQAIESNHHAVQHGPELGFAWNNLAGLLFQQNRHAEALQAGERATGLQPTDVSALSQLATIYASLRRFDEAEATFARALSLPGDHSGTLLNRAWMHSMRGAWQQALMDYERLPDQKQPHVLRAMSLALLHLNEPQRARDLAEQAVVAADTAPIHWGLLAVAEQRLGRAAAAAAAAEGALRACEGRVPHLASLGAEYMRLSALALAVAAFDRALDKEPSNIDVLHDRALALSLDAQWDEARVAYLRVLDLAPGLISAWEGLARLRHQRLDLDGTIQALVRITELAPESEQTWRWLGTVYMQQGKTEQAKSAFERALEIDPKSVAALGSLGLLVLQSQQIERLRDLTERMVALAPNHYLTLQSQMHLALAQGQIDVALDAAEKVAELNPQEPAVWKNLVQIYAMKGRPYDSLNAFERGVQLWPSQQNWHALGISSLNAEDLVRADRAFEQMRRLSHERQDDLENFLGGTYAKADYWPQARAAFARAVELNPGHRAAWFNLAMAELRNEQPEAALDAFERGLQVSPEGARLEQWLRLFAPQRGIGHLERMLRLLSHATQQYPESAQLWAILAWNALSKGDVDQAEHALVRMQTLSPQDAGTHALKAGVALAKNEVGVAISSTSEAIAAADAAWIETNLTPLFQLLVKLAVHGGAAEVRSLIESASHVHLGERLLAFKAALDAKLSCEPQRLQELAPEVRQAAEFLLAVLSPSSDGSQSSR